ncbi:MAG TPA: hypothetical protein VMP68_02125 [Candidatus Eisenbacteria bacterium]|nr:hypothetical protein [Candidatus Eisenbacteria bacterium]
MSEEEALRRPILCGWKQIANYLSMGVRTVQRHERLLKLPIYRPAGRSCSTVLAFKDELNTWASRQNSPPSSIAYRSFHRAGADFLRVDSEIALTLASIALGTRDPEKRTRTIQSALRAYEVITRLRQNIAFDESEEANLNANLKRLKNDLRTLGQAV